MAVVQTKIENEQDVSLPRRIAAYLTSMNFSKVFRRQHHHHHSRESSSTVPKPALLAPHHHHRYPRPFSYHIPATEKLPPTSLAKPSNVIPYHIGLSSDSGLLNNAQTNEHDEIVRLPTKTGRGYSPKIRKDRRLQSQLNINKRWLYRSMETLDGWKGKVFPQKIRTTSSSQLRSRSVDNLADGDPDETRFINHNPSTTKQLQQRAVSPNQSIETITNRVINGMGIHRKSTNSIPNIARSPALTIHKQPLFMHSTNGLDKIPTQYNNGTNSSAILDFREISSSGFLQSRSRLTDENENNSLTPSESHNNGMNSNDDEQEEVTSNISFLGNGYDHHNNDDNETAASWDFSITWIDSLKEQHSPQRKIQFYENLIKLLEQDTLNIDELLVLRKVLSKIWPIDDASTIDNSNHLNSIGTKSLHAPNKIKRRPKLSTMTHHTAQRCSAILEQSPLVYETLHEQNSGHTTKQPSLLLATKAKPCFIETTNETISNEKSHPNIEHNYPQHLNPFHDETDIIPSAPPEESGHKNNESIRRYFERLTLLETIYEKLNNESNTKSLESPDHQQKLSIQSNTTESITQKYSTSEKQIETKPLVANHPLNKIDTNKTTVNKFSEMNVDGNGSVSSGKSSMKRRAPTAPHISQKDTTHYRHPTNPTMFALSAIDLHGGHRPDQEINIPIQIQSHDTKLSREVSPKGRSTPSTHTVAASCDEDGHVFIYEPESNDIHHHHIDEGQSVTLPKRTERVQEWLSLCEERAEANFQNNLSRHTSPNTDLTIRCIAKPVRHSSPSLRYHPEKNLSPKMKTEVEPGRFRSSLKIHLETNEPINHRSRVLSATARNPQRQPTTSDRDNKDIDFPKHVSSRSYQHDHQAVYL